MGYLIVYMVIAIPVLVLYLWLSRRARKEWLLLMGQVKPTESYGWDRRKYVRLNTVFPVELQHMDSQKATHLYEGFTRDISKRGICVEVKELHGKPLENIVPDSTKLKLLINMPLYAEPTEASGVVKWIQKLEGVPMDKYAIGISYENIREEDASRIVKYALWLYRRPAFIASVIVLLIMITTILFTSASNLRIAKRRLQEEVETGYKEKRSLMDRVKKVEHEKGELSSDLERAIEKQKILSAPAVFVKEKKPDVIKTEEPYEVESSFEWESEEYEEEFPEEQLLEEEEFFEELSPVLEEELLIDEDEVEEIEEEEFGITKEMIEDEVEIYKKFRDYILKGDIQLLDRYCYQHRSSIYHAAGLFALAELRYENRHDWKSIENSYQEVIKRYPQSKYATYSSHRLKQIERRLAYSTYSLRYFYILYNLPPLFDYREIEPHIEE